MAAEGNYPATPRIGTVTISTANANRDGTGTIGTLISAGASGSEVYYIRAKARGATTAGMLRFFLHDGTVYRGLLAELPVEAVPAPSATVMTWEGTLPLTLMAQGRPGIPLALPSGWSIRVSTHNGESFDVTAVGADF